MDITPKKDQLHDIDSLRLPNNFWYKTIKDQKIPSTNLFFLFSLVDKLYPNFDRRVDTFDNDMKINLCRILSKYTFKPITPEKINFPLICGLAAPSSSSEGMKKAYETYNELYGEYMLIK